MIEDIVLHSLTGALTGIWAFLFTGPLSESGMVFGWLKSFIFRTCPQWVYLPLVGCAKCNAFWWAVAVSLKQGEANAPVFIIAVFTAYLMEKQLQQ